MLWNKIDNDSFKDKNEIKFWLVIFALLDIYKWLFVINLLALSCQFWSVGNAF